jgi:hypothetical protein
VKDFPFLHSNLLCVKGGISGMSEEKKRKEVEFWEKVQALWHDWKVTISMVWFFFLATIGLIVIAVSYWVSGEWNGSNFSGEVDAAMINSLVAIFVTVPITLLTGAGTILVTAYFNLQTQKIAVQAQRSQLRDKILEKRLEIYQEIHTVIINIWEKLRNIVYGYSNDDYNPRLIINKLNGIRDHKRWYISRDVDKHISNVYTISRILEIAIRNNAPEEELKNLFRDFVSKLDNLFHSINKELDFEMIERDWKYLQQYRIDEE